MKNIFYLLFTAFLFMGCEDDLDLAPISDAGSNGFYMSTGDFEQGVNGIYASLGVQNNVDYASFYVVMDESRSDNIYTPGTAGVRDWNAINNFLPTISTLGTISNVWNVTFNAIMRANTILDQLESNGNVIEDPSLAIRFEAEAKFLRAYFYFDLVKWFGPVPIFETFVTPTEALNIGRSPVQDVYSLILSDLNFAINNLAASHSGGNVGRATSVAARALLAKVYLTRSGPQLHPDGPCMASGEYNQALEQLNAVINSGQFEMLDDYGKIFDYDNEGNSEIVWDFQFIAGGVGAGGYYPTEYYDEGWARVTLPFAGGNPGDGSKRISDDLLASYESGDVRPDHTFQLRYLNEEGDTVDAQFYNKFMDVERAGGDRFDWSLNYPAIRFTDILLMKAECILQGASGSQGEVDQIVNDVRTRAGLAAVNNVTLDMLLDERRLEFAGENLRWDDLVRTGRVVDIMNTWIADEDDSGNMQSMEVDDIIYPVPQLQIDVKEGLYFQNPGYL